MQAPKGLRPPTNWQDFESLCKQLWGEIWHSAEIKKNGRWGQPQKGVDIYGKPYGENYYVGIQCKLKDINTGKPLTEKEILDKVAEAKKFLPAIKKYYIVTTSEKDEKIEEFVRLLDMKNVDEGSFEIHLFSWNDLVELIDRNKLTHNWYVHSQGFSTVQKVSVTFANGKTSLLVQPIFKQETVVYLQKIPGYQTMKDGLFVIGSSGYIGPQINRSYFGIKLMIQNIGWQPITNFKLVSTFSGCINGIAISNIFNYVIVPGTIQILRDEVQIDVHQQRVKFIPQHNTLVSEEVYTCDEIFIKIPHINNKLVIDWKLLSNDYKDEGQLIITVLPTISYTGKEISTEDPLEAKQPPIRKPVEDHITDYP